MASEEPSGVLSFKVYVLKVAIHCEGCKKKIHRILKAIDGVYQVDIDAPQNKVTVMANVDGDALVRKLAKSRKHAELLPPPPPPPEKKAADGDGSEPTDDAKEPSEPKQQEENGAAEDAAAAAVEQKTADSAAAEPAKTTEVDENGKEQAKSDDETVEVSNPPPETEEKAPAATEAVGAGVNDSTAGGGRKKKGKKAQKDGDGEAADGASVDVAADGPVLVPAPYIYPYPFYPSLQQHPPYLVSYNVAEPSVSTAHYVPAVHPASQAFVYHPYPPPPEFYYEGPPLPHPQSYSMFSDENPNACNLM